MERLKTALDKARQIRATAQHSQDREVAAVMPEADTSQLPAPLVNVWQLVREVSIDPDRLADARIVRENDANAFEALRSRLQGFCDQHARSRIALSAPTHGCGVTTFALNLAFSFARRTDAKVLLVDLHHEAPAIAQRLGLTGTVSVARVICEGAPLPQILHRFGSKLIITAGPADRRSSTSVPSLTATGRFLDELQTRFRPDVMLLDLPPVLDDPQGVSLIGLSDACLLVASARVTSAPDLDEAARLISDQTAYLGAALNQSAERTARRRRHAIA
jgi:Mrp family chromosome partitioning ATPase